MKKPIINQLDREQMRMFPDSLWTTSQEIMLAKLKLRRDIESTKSVQYLIKILTKAEAQLNQETKPIYFKQATKNLSKPKSMKEDECGSLWVYNDGEICISCWKVPFIKRIKLLIFGKVWLGIVSGQSQPPCWIEIEKTPFK